MSRIIEVVDYDPVWIAAFEKETALLNAIFGQRVIEVHHIGSTAVMGTEPRVGASHSAASTTVITVTMTLFVFGFSIDTDSFMQG